MTTGAAVLCGLVLLISAVSKVRTANDYAEFVASIPAFEIPARWTRLFAVLTVVAEFGISGLLLASLIAGYWAAVAGLVLAAGMFAVLTAVVWRAVSRRSGAVCRCFGRARTTLTHRHTARNAFLLGVAVLGLSAVDNAFDPVVAGLAAAVGVIGAVLVVRFDDLADLVAGPV
ncbi:MauE/DoxX family redox-associated membrane protein [Lentzea sp. NPDC005914]|uniref:MauE/DoxX family redox-associated membrane protein n=1 Tax=Lentzea sp. NPDC005914 TaxID=3154572 RepID=UPI0033D5AC0A